MSAISPEQVKRYYDVNTPAFERLGQGGAAIRRAVFGPGVETRARAFEYVDELIAEELSKRFGAQGHMRVLDLGCGVGTSLLRLAKKLDLDGVGVTISSVQAERAKTRFRAAGLAQKLECLEMSYTDLPDSLGTFDAAFAIESFVHAPSPDVFFEQASRRIRKGGVLIVCDDLLTREGATSTTRRASRLLTDFREGWLAASPVSDEAVLPVAQKFGLSRVRNDDLTPYLELRRPRDLAITALMAIGGRLPIQNEMWRCWKGGNALQLGLVEGLIAYRFMVFERT